MCVCGGRGEGVQYLLIGVLPHLVCCHVLCVAVMFFGLDTSNFGSALKTRFTFPFASPIHVARLYCLLSLAPRGGRRKKSLWLTVVPSSVTRADSYGSVTATSFIFIYCVSSARTEHFHHDRCEPARGLCVHFVKIKSRHSEDKN